MAIRNRYKNSKDTFFGGSGVVIPMRRRQESQPLDPNGVIKQEHLDQIMQEAREQWGYQPETDELMTELDPSKEQEGDNHDQN